MNQEPRALSQGRLIFSAAVLVALLSFWLLYFPRAALTIQESDGAEFALVAAKGSLAHPPGYPLYSWLGQLLAQLFPQNPYYVLAVFSAVCQALAAGILVLVLSALSGSFLVGLAFSLGWALYEPSLLTATDAEVFALHHFLIVCVLGLAIGAARSRRSAIFLGLLLGCAAAHQHLLALFLPLIAGLCWNPAHGRATFFRTSLATAFFVAVALYLSLFLRYAHAPELAFAPLESSVDFLTYLLRGGYGTFSLVLDGAPTEASYASAVWRGLFVAMPAAFILSILLPGLTLWKRSAVTWGASASLILTWLFSLGLTVPAENHELSNWVMRFYPTIALVVLCGACVAFNALRIRRAAVATVVAVVSLAASLWGLPATMRASDFSSNVLVEREVQAILSDAPNSAVVIVGSDRLVFGLAYFQRVFEERADLQVVTLGKLESQFYRKRLIATLDLPPGTTEESLQDVGTLARLLLSTHRKVFAEPAVPVPQGLQVERQGALNRWIQF
ncbi:MAG: DUF2723 domain-containing protein [Deltaproteobacteria bacterium]|nr:DUF2723 domain-containing protein [Deltaproteobacteria bacterium]